MHPQTVGRQDQEKLSLRECSPQSTRFTLSVPVCSGVNSSSSSSADHLPCSTLHRPGLRSPSPCSAIVVWVFIKHPSTLITHAPAVVCLLRACLHHDVASLSASSAASTLHKQTLQTRSACIRQPRRTPPDWLLLPRSDWTVDHVFQLLQAVRWLRFLHQHRARVIEQGKAAPC